jgi:nucleoid-associated protein YgaU
MQNAELKTRRPAVALFSDSAFIILHSAFHFDLERIPPMRKDVKIGLGIGGVLLAVLIVYALVPKNDTQIARNGDAAKSTEDAGPIASTASNTTGGTTTGSPSPASESTGPGPAAHDTPGVNPPTTEHVASREGTTGDQGEQDTAQATTAKIDWDKILKTGLVPDDAKVPMVAHREADDVFGGGSSEPTWDPKPAPQHTNLQVGGNPGAKTTQVAQGNGGIHAKPVADAKPQAARGGMTDHTVQQGENLSMIAAVAYGDARKYKEILKANPGLDERKIRAGTVIKLPDASTFASATPAAHQAKADAKPETKIDPRSQYKVEQDDNLSRISAKLYGSTAKAKALYEANKDTIGADPGKLKLGTVLKLPEPPTAQQAAR